MSEEPARPPRAFGYIRVSTGKQAKVGDGLEAQRQGILRHYDYYLKPNGCLWAGFVEDPGVSGSKPFAQRKGGASLNGTLEKGDAVIVLKVDRIFRSLEDCVQQFGRWKKRGVKFYPLDLGLDLNSPIGEAFMQMMAVFAQLERARISERVREATAVRRAQKGRAVAGRPVYGTRYTGPYGKRMKAPNPEQRVIGRKILELLDKGYAVQQIYIYFLEQRVRYKGREIGETAIRTWARKERQLQKEEQQHDHKNSCVDSQAGGE